MSPSDVCIICFNVFGECAGRLQLWTATGSQKKILQQLIIVGRDVRHNHFKDYLFTVGGRTANRIYRTICAYCWRSIILAILDHLRWLKFGLTVVFRLLFAIPTGIASNNHLWLACMSTYGSYGLEQLRPRAPTSCHWVSHSIGLYLLGGSGIIRMHL